MRALNVQGPYDSRAYVLLVSKASSKEGEQTIPNACLYFERDDSVVGLIDAGSLPADASG
jgi:hypothetical protein